MKKILTLFFCALIPFFAKAQDASISEFFGAEMKFYAQQFDGQDYLILSFKSSEDCIPLNQTEMKLEFFNGEIVKLEGYGVNSKTEISGYQGQYYSSSSEKVIIVLRFDLTEHDVENFESGIKNIAIYTVPKVFRRTYDKDKIGKKIYNAFKEQKNLF